jgi:hypothetical protein
MCVYIFFSPRSSYRAISLRGFPPWRSFFLGVGLEKKALKFLSLENSGLPECAETQLLCTGVYFYFSQRGTFKNETALSTNSLTPTTDLL